MAWQEIPLIHYSLHFVLKVVNLPACTEPQLQPQFNFVF